MRFKIYFVVLASIAAFSSPITTYAQLDNQLQQQLFLGIKYVEEAVNNKNIEAIKAVISPNARPGLADEIESSLGEARSIRFAQFNTTYEQIAENQFKATSKYEVRVQNIGSSWSVSGLKNYFVFEAIDGRLYVLDTDLPYVLSKQSLGDFFQYFGLIGIPILFAVGGFWLWMLIDVVKRPLEKKTKWVLIVALLQWLGALIYFCTARRKSIKQEKMIAESPSVPIQGDYPPQQ
jgi:hypothetical protein